MSLLPGRRPRGVPEGRTGSRLSDRITERSVVYAAGLLVGVATVVVTTHWLGVIHGDLLIGREAARTLLSSQVLDTYLHNVSAQMGPLAIALAPLPTPVYYLGVAALVAVVVPLLVLSRPRVVAAVPALLTGAVWCAAVPVPWSQLAWKGHVDDALVLVGTAVLLAARARGNGPGQLGGLALGLLGKPTAVLLVPALLPSVPLFALGLVVMTLIWGPFVVHAPGQMLEVGKGVTLVGRGSALNWMGFPVLDHPPSWLRPVQAVAGTVAVLASLVRDRAAEGILLGFTLRALIEPNPAPAYVIPLVVLAVVPDLTLGLPVFTLVSSVAFYQAQETLNGGASWPRLVALVVVAALATIAITLPQGLRLPRSARTDRGQPPGPIRDVPAADVPAAQRQSSPTPRA